MDQRSIGIVKKDVMRIALYSSKRSRCGIATYTSYLEVALRKLGADVQHWGSSELPRETFSEINSWNPEIFHAQHEPSIMPSNDVLARFTNDRAGHGRKNILTLHTETPSSVGLSYRSGIQAVIIHRLPKLLKNAHVLPMPCPVQERLIQRNSLLRRYGFPDDAFIVSTVGFMLPWKMTVEVVDHLLPWLRSRQNVHIQVIASQHFSPGAADYMKKCSKSLSALSNAVDGRIRHVSHYPSDQEVLERLLLSDLGYVYCPIDTSSASAAASLFVSARCPLVTSASTHYDHLMCHAVRAPKENVELFAKAIVDAAQDQDLLLRLREYNEFLYAETNYLECARKHMGIYGNT